jgi:hypothetical protein
MANGYQIDPLGIMLETVLDLKEASGRIEQRLDDGKEFHHEVRSTLKDYGGRLTVLEQRRDDDRLFSTVLKWAGRLHRLWPLLFLLMNLALAIGLHVPAGVQEFMAHSKPE